MGYSTDFWGKFTLNKKLGPKRHEYLNKFASTRRMARKLDAKYGVEGEFYADAGGMCGQAQTPDIIDYNRPPSTQPGLWCQWVPTADGLGIEWDGNEKFYNYVAWLEYIIKNFLVPAQYVLNGTVRYQGEDSSDFGKIIVKNNVVTVARGKQVYENEEA